MIGDRWDVTDDEVARPYPCEPVVGEPFTRAGGRHVGRILSVDAPRQLTDAARTRLLTFKSLAESDP